MQSPEFSKRFGELDNVSFVEQLFLNILRRPAAQNGIDFWTGHLGNGLSRPKLLSQLSDSPENRVKTVTYDLRFDADGNWLFCTTVPKMCLQ